jgi:hypothetical protein
LEEGDVFQLQQVLINTKNVSSGSILIETDTLVIMTVGYYDVALGTYQTTAGVGKGADGGDHVTYNIPLPYSVYLNTAAFDDNQAAYNANYTGTYETIDAYPAGYYMLRTGDADADTPFTQDIQFTIPAGSYTPEKLSSMITDKVAGSIDSSLQGGVGTTKGLLIRNSSDDFVKIPGGDLTLVVI